MSSQCRASHGAWGCKSPVRPSRASTRSLGHRTVVCPPAPRPSIHPGLTCRPKWNSDPVDTGLDHAHLGSSLSVLCDLGPVAHRLWPRTPPQRNGVGPGCLEAGGASRGETGLYQLTHRDPSGLGVAVEVELSPPHTHPASSEVRGPASLRTEIPPSLPAPGSLSLLHSAAIYWPPAVSPVFHAGDMAAT